MSGPPRAHDDAAAGDVPASDPRRPLDPRDYSRRTVLANERTALAWWRTGLTTPTVALAAARVVPELGAVRARWPYTAIGVAFALLGTACLGYGEVRRAAVDRAIRRGEDLGVDAALTRVAAVTGVVLGLALTGLILLDA